MFQNINHNSAMISNTKKNGSIVALSTFISSDNHMASICSCPLNHVGNFNDPTLSQILSLILISGCFNRLANTPVLIFSFPSIINTTLSPFVLLSKISLIRSSLHFSLRTSLPHSSSNIFLAARSWITCFAFVVCRACKPK